LGGVDGAEDQVVLVEGGRPGEVLRGARRLEGELAEEGAPVGEAGGQLLQLLEVPQPGRDVVVPLLAERTVEAADPMQLGGQGGWLRRGQLAAERDEDRPLLPRRRGHARLVPALEGAGA